MATLSVSRQTSVHLSWIDDAKMLAMVTVIFSHCMGDFPEKMWGYDLAKDMIVSFNMPLFMLLAGYTSTKSLEHIANRHDYLHYVGKIVLHLLLPTYAIGLLRAILMLDVAAIGNEQWFLKMLFRYLLVFATVNWLVVLLNRKVNKSDRSQMILPSWLSVLRYVLFFLLMFILPSSKLPEFATYFILGYLFRKHRLIEQASSFFHRWWFSSVTMAVLMLSVIVFVWSFGHSRGHNFYNEPFWVLYASGQLPFFVYRQLCALSCCMFLLMVIILLSRRYTWWSYCGSKTLGLYVIHTFLLHVFVEPLNIMHYTGYYWGWAGAIVLTVLLTIMSLAVIYLFERNVYTNLLFLGNIQSVGTIKYRWIRKKLEKNAK